MPTPDRLPQPPGPPTLASILADHEREKRRQQRPVSPGIATPSGAPSDVSDAPDELFYGTSVSGDFYDVLDPLTVTLDLPEGHLWEVKARIIGSATVTSSAAVRSFIVFMDSVYDPAIYGTDFFLPQAISRFTATGTAGGYTITDAYVFGSGVAQGSFTVSTFVGGGEVTVNSASASLSVEARWLRALVPGDTP